MSITPSFPRVLSRRNTASTSSTPSHAQLQPHPNTPIDLQSLFRLSERIIATQSCRVRTGFNPFIKSEVAVVGSSTNLGEQAAVFILTAPSATQAPEILHVIPISQGFRYRLEQAPPSPSSSFFHQSAKPHITLCLSHDHVKVELRISAAQTAKVQKLVAELRKLNEAAVKAAIPKALTHSWVRLYPTKSAKADEVDDLASPETSASTPTPTPAGISPSASTGTLSVETPLTSLTLGTCNEEEEEQYPDPYLPTFSRVSFIRRRLFARQEKWSSQTPIRIRTATYNVNDKVPPAGTRELAPLVGEGEEDLLVFGFQEVDLRGQALLISQGNVRAEGWEGALFAGLGAKADEYEKLVMTQYVGVMMIVLVRRSIKEAVTRVETSERGIGLLGFGGNKAGVAVRLRIHDSTFCFVNAHMAAFATALDRRRSDYLVLKTGLTFPQPPHESATLAFEEFSHEKQDRLLSQEDSNLLVWMGDLNYRVDLPDTEVRKLAEEKKWSEMLEKDQLRADIAAEKSFAGFQEHLINFPPTFKYVHGSTTLDTRRAPAYTDRILWSLPSPSATSAFSSNSKPLSPPQPIECREYTSHDILWSDHRPVSASFETSVRVVDEPTRSAELGVVMKELDKLEEVYRPSLDIDQLNLEFGEVRYGRPVEREIKLRNMGRVPATYTFKSPAIDRPFCKPFLWPFPSSAVVEPGQSVYLKVVISVDEAWAAKLTLGDDINDVLVLQIAGGRDTFITIQATFLPSIIALPLHLLSSLPSPIRQVSLADRKVLARPLAPGTAGGNGGNGEAPPRPVRDIWKLLEYLMSYGQGVDGLWLEGEDVLDIIEHLDAGLPIPTDTDTTPNQAKNVSAALLHLLSSLPTPLLPLHHQSECLKASDRDEAFAALEEVPQINTNVLIGLMSVVRLCAAQPITDGNIHGDGDAAVADADTAAHATATAEATQTRTETSAADTTVTSATDDTSTRDKESEIDETFKIEDDDDLEVEETPEAGSEGVQPTVVADVLASVEQAQPSAAPATPAPPATAAATSSTAPGEQQPPSTPQNSSAPTMELSSVGETSHELVDVLYPAVFGLVPSEDGRAKDAKRRFVRLLLEG